MQEGRGAGAEKFYLCVFAVIIASFLGLRLINYFLNYGSVEIAGQKFRTEIARKEWELAQGLSGRKSLSDGSALLFVFESAESHEFWMKDMKFSIDIIWINDGKIIDIKEKAPVPVTHYLEKYRPKSPAKYVLEINAGLAEKYGFKVGDSVKLDI